MGVGKVVAQGMIDIILPQRDHIIVVIFVRAEGLQDHPPTDAGHQQAMIVKLRVVIGSQDLCIS